MSKPLKTSEILSFLIKNYEKKTNFYTLREICDSLSVSQKTVIKINKEFLSYLKEPGHKISDLQGKDDVTLNTILSLSSTSNSNLSNDDYDVLLKYLAKPKENAKSILETIKNELAKEPSNYYNFHQNDSEPITESISFSGKNFLLKCNYSTYNFNLHHYCQVKGYSDRFKYKPGVFLEIGIISQHFSSNDEIASKKSLEETRKYIFYAYLPFSRAVCMTLIDSKSFDLTTKMITSLIFFLLPKKGLPQKIIGNGRIGEIFKKADLRLFKNYFNFCDLIYSSNPKYCVFVSQESHLIENVWASLDQKKVHGLPKNLQDRIDMICDIHNRQKFVTDALKDEIVIMQEHQYPKATFTHNIGRTILQRNNHIYFRNHWYSSMYTCREPFLALEFNNGNAQLITTTFVDGKEKTLSFHPLYLEDEVEKKSKYTSEQRDLAPSDEEAKKYGLWTRDEIINKIMEKYSIKGTTDEIQELASQDPVIQAVNLYIDSREYPQQAYKLVYSMCFKDKLKIWEIKQKCIEILEEKNIRRFAVLFASLVTSKEENQTTANESLIDDDYIGNDDSNSSNPKTDDKSECTLDFDYDDIPF